MNFEIWAYKNFVRVVKGKNVVDIDIMFLPVFKTAFEIAEALGSGEIKAKRLKIFTADVQDKR